MLLMDPPAYLWQASHVQEENFIRSAFHRSLILLLWHMPPTDGVLVGGLMERGHGSYCLSATISGRTFLLLVYGQLVEDATNKLIIEWTVARVKFVSIQLQFDWISLGVCEEVLQNFNWD